MSRLRNGRVRTLRRERFDLEALVQERYERGARRREKDLCCSVDYDPRYLKVIPEEILKKDYGCGDPARWVRKGEAVLDLGSGAGKICYIASQIVGPKGKVTGIDFNPEMLALARRYQEEICRRIGYQNVEFRRGRIQDLKTDLDRIDAYLKAHPLRSAGDFLHFEAVKERMREESPLVSTESINVIISSCVLNLVRREDRKALFREMHRVLKKGGKAAISDIVSDEPVPEALQEDPELWTGCISGAFQEREFLEVFAEAGFYGVRIEKRDEKPWRTVSGIEFRAITVTAYKGKEGLCWERNQAVIYRGPWKQVEDDDHHRLRRGVRTAVCDKTFQIFSKDPYHGDVILVPPRREIPLTKAKPFSATNRGGSATQSGGDCSRNPERGPRETKGKRYQRTTSAVSVCTPGTCC